MIVVTAIGLGITGVSLLSTIVAASAVIGMEAVSIVMLAVSTLSTISSLISKALADDSISDEEYSLILLEFETFTRTKEDIRIKFKTSLENLII